MNTLHNYIYVFSILCYNGKVNNVDLTQIKAVAFDIDGTLYRAWKFNIRVFPYFMYHSFFFLKYGLVRNIMHRTAATPEFLKLQASHMAKKLKCSPEEAEQRLEKIIYKGLEKYFVNIKPCDGALDFIHKLKDNGYKLGLLSDFPPEQKGEVWGVRSLCDVVLGSEEAGALKPDSTPFLKLAEQFNLPPEQILYVGNNHKYDIQGAHNIGMKTAWLILPHSGWIGKKSKIADFTFWHYNQLSNWFFGAD